MSKKELEITEKERAGEKCTEEKTPADHKRDLGKTTPEKLTDLKGIGPALEQKLRVLCGIEDLEDLATSRPDEVAAMTKITQTIAKGIVMQAQEALIPKMDLTSVVEEDLWRKKRELIFKTGSPKFNRILAGGVHTMAITGTAGRLASGKSVIGEDICIDAIHNHYTCPKCGYRLNKGNKCPECNEMAAPVEAMIIETEPDTVHLDRMKEMAIKKGYKDMDWSRLIHIPARKVATIKSQYLWYKVLHNALKDHSRNIRLVVIDSFNAKIRAGWSRSEMLPIRSRELAEHFLLMEFIAARYNLAWYLTNQVIAPPRPDQGLGVKVKFTDTYYPVGGDTLLHSVNQWIALTQVKSSMWRAQIFDSSYLPRDEANFIIDTSGLQDAVE